MMKALTSSSAAVLAAFCVASCSSGDEIQVRVLDAAHQPIAASVVVNRENEWYHSIINPVGATYRARYRVMQRWTPCKIAVEQGDRIAVYIAPRFLPVSIQFGEGKAHVIDKQMHAELLARYNKREHAEGREITSSEVGLMAYFDYSKGVFTFHEQGFRTIYSRDGIEYCEQSHRISK